MKTKIDKGIKRPVIPNAYPKNLKYPFAYLEVDDSFFVNENPSYAKTLCNNANRKHAPKVFSVYEVEGGARFFRDK
jgi:hypothetical protein